jgi:phage major head subunit gpT-like protein
MLSNIANKSARRGYMAVEQEWRKIASIRPVNDLKEHKAYSLTGDMSFQKVGAGGELKHAELGEEEYSNSADTYGRMFAISRRDIINDDLGAFNQIRSMLGRGAALSLNKVVWTEWLDNAATFWTAARNNLLTGAASALDIDSLSAAVTAFEEQVDPDGNPLGLMPAVLIVPSALKVQGMRIASDSEIRQDGNTAKTQYFVKNPWAGQFELCSSQYLNNANIPGGSATAWWLAASPEDTPSLEVVFLNGRQAPSVEQANADFNTLGIQMRGYFDFGAAKQNHRASVMSAGA